MTTTSTTSLAPVSQIGKTILGIQRELYAYSGLVQPYDTATTLNAKYSVAQTVTPTSPPKVLYFGIGIGGSFNVDSSNLSQPHGVRDTNMDLYTPIPFRCVPIAQDLTTTERALYRMRVRKTISGSDYYCYYLKVATYNESTVQLTSTDPVTALQSPYVIDYTNLNPTPPAVNTSGLETSAATEVNASVTTTLPLTGMEVTEVINVLYAGDLRRASISEIGLYSGQDQVISATDANGNAFSYLEAIFAQLNMHYTALGDNWSNPARTSSYQIVQGSGKLLLL
jgi:hypothetical protein